MYIIHNGLVLYGYANYVNGHWSRSMLVWCETVSIATSVYIYGLVGIRATFTIARHFFCRLLSRRHNKLCGWIVLQW